MGLTVDYRSQKWRAQFDDLVGGWCITLAADPRTPAGGANWIADFVSQDIAEYMAALHNSYLDAVNEAE
jgi:hypothetical protein